MFIHGGSGRSYLPETLDSVDSTAQNNTLSCPLGPRGDEDTQVFRLSIRKPGELPTDKSLDLLLDVASAVRAIQILE